MYGIFTQNLAYVHGLSIAYQGGLLVHEGWETVDQDIGYEYRPRLFLLMGRSEQ